MKKSIAIIGLKEKGRKHLSELRRSDYFNLVGICDSSVKEDFGRFEIFDDIDSMFNSTKPEAVVITTNYKNHKDIIIKCMKYVKNIFIETPFSDSIENAREIQYIARTNELKIAIGFSQRFNPTILSLTKELEKQEKVYSITFIKGSQEDENFDVINSMLIQDIDLLRFITKSEFSSAHIQKMVRENKTTSISAANLLTKSGILVNIVSNSYYHNKRAYMEIVTSSGVFLADLIGFTLHKVTNNGRINYKVDTEDFSTRLEHKQFLNMCNCEKYDSLAIIEDVIKAREVFNLGKVGKA